MELQIAELLVLAASSIAALVLYTLSLTGCASNSPGLPGIFLVAINSSAAAELRIGYFGACISSSGSRTCVATPYSTTPQSLKEAFISQSGRENTKSSIPSLSTLQTALQLQRDIFFCIQAFAGVVFIVGILLSVARVFLQVSKGKDRHWRFIEKDWSGKVLLASIVASAISATSITQTSNALRFVTRSSGARSLHIEAGYTLQVLQWLAFASSAMVYIVGARQMAQETRRKQPEDEDGTNGKASSPSPEEGAKIVTLPSLPKPPGLPPPPPPL